MLALSTQSANTSTLNLLVRRIWPFYHCAHRRVSLGRVTRAVLRGGASRDGLFTWRSVTRDSGGGSFLESHGKVDGLAPECSGHEGGCGGGVVEDDGGHTQGDCG